MSQRAVLVLCRDASRYVRVSRALDAGLRSRLRGVTCPDDARDLIEVGAAGLLVCEVAPSYGLDALDHLLWVLSSLRRRPPVLVLAEEYDPEQATTAYRMGVCEYLAFRDHAGILSQVMNDLLRGNVRGTALTTGAVPEASLALSPVR